jgi:hypothetical protein
METPNAQPNVQCKRKAPRLQSQLLEGFTLEAV